MMLLWMVFFGFLTLGAAANSMVGVAIVLGSCAVLGEAILGYLGWLLRPSIGSFTVAKDGLTLSYLVGPRRGPYTIPWTKLHGFVLDSSRSKLKHGPLLAEKMRTKYWLLFNDPRAPLVSGKWLGVSSEAVAALSSYLQFGQLDPNGQWVANTNT